MPILLSIVIPGVPRRIDQGRALVAELERQVAIFNLQKTVEVIWLVDNYHRTIGAKRQALVETAQGEYIVFIDDDDKVSPDYIELIIQALKANPDVVTFQSDVTWNGLRGIISFSALCDKDEPFYGPEKVTNRRPWHICVWKRSISLQCKFPDINWGEDSAWVDQAVEHLTTEIHIPQVLHIYSHYDHTSESITRLRQDGK